MPGIGYIADMDFNGEPIYFSHVNLKDFRLQPRVDSRQNLELLERQRAKKNNSYLNNEKRGE